MDTHDFLGYLGKKIRAARKARNISQEKLAELSGLHPTYISDIENGKVNASIYSCYQISRALETPLAEFLPVSGKIDHEVEQTIIEMSSYVRQLDKKMRALFLSAVKGLMAGIGKVK